MKMNQIQIIFTKLFDRQLEKVPLHIRKKFMLWLFSVETIGPSSTMKCKGYHDEPLKGERFGQRSIRLNKSYRMIYRILDGYLIIELLEIHKHDY
jgi:proteic killer suppression protein